jgi:ABC-type iron transport system FetAB ATPase subunit
MNIQQIFQDPRIVMLEEEIARRNEHCRYSDEEKHVMKYFLEERRNVLWASECV